MKPIYVKIQDYTTGTGIQDALTIGWQYGREDKGCTQKLYRILIKRENEIIFDSQFIESARQNSHRISPVLQSHQKYAVIVETMDDQGNTGQSCPVYFITGICHEKDWEGDWISNKSNMPHYLGIRLNLEKTIQSACISIAGVGQYELKINGVLPDDSVLNGSWTDFHKHIHYRTFDIGGFLRKGENKISIEVGNGWYHAVVDERHFYTGNQGYEPFGKFLCAKACMTVRFTDGGTFRKGTDASWKTWTGGTIYTNIYGSEDYDAVIGETRQERPAAVLAEEEAPQGRLIPMQYPPVKVKEVYEGTFIKKIRDGSFLYDLGQNMSGLFEITVSGERNTKIKIVPYEKLDTKQNPDKTVDTWCTYTLGGKGAECWKPRFTYGAGRYLLIGLHPDSEGKKMPEILRVRGHFITSSAEDAGSFSCSDRRYMQIYHLILKAMESNLHHIHTDCPTIERLGWQEPNHLMGPSVMYVKNVDTLWDKLAMDQRDSQYKEGEYDVDTGAFPHRYGPGLIPSIAPRYAKFLKDTGEGSFWDIVPWGSSILLAGYEQYRFYGNKEALLKNYDAAKKYVDYLCEKRDSQETHFLNHGLGDWGIEQNKGESRENIETAYLYRDLMILSMAADWQGKVEEAQYYKKLAGEIKEMYNQTLLVAVPETGEWAYRTYDREGIVLTQAAQAIPLCFKMVPKEKEESVRKSFLYTCRDHVLRTGEIGLPYILRTLGEMGKPDIVHDMIVRREHPGYYRFVLNGETTLPEFWRDDARSKNHDMMGAAMEWFYRYLAGISSEDGFWTIRISPSLPRGINFVKCSYLSVHGYIRAEVKRTQAGEYSVKAEIPANTSGIVLINGKKFQISGGEAGEFC